MGAKWVQHWLAWQLDLKSTAQANAQSVNIQSPPEEIKPTRKVHLHIPADQSFPPDPDLSLQGAALPCPASPWRSPARSPTPTDYRHRLSRPGVSAAKNTAVNTRYYPVAWYGDKLESKIFSVFGSLWYSLQICIRTKIPAGMPKVIYHNIWQGYPAQGLNLSPNQLSLCRQRNPCSYRPLDSQLKHGVMPNLKKAVTIFYSYWR